jgi:spore maturation protein CgeB
MHFVIFCHSLTSDWGNPDAHFQRGLVAELQADGHVVDVYEPEDGWSRRNLVLAEGHAALVAFATRFPTLHSRRYRPGGPNLDRALAEADVVLVHESTDAALVAAVGAHHAAHGHYRLLYHDTHHRAAAEPAAWEALELGSYDAALVSGRALAEVYERRASIRRVHVWHEAADLRLLRRGARLASFDRAPRCDLVWSGDFGADGDDDALLEELLLAPIRDLALDAVIYGARCSPAARAAIERAGAVHRGYLPNPVLPAAFARARVTVHVPTRAHAEALPGLPSVRPFEALAAGMPLVAAAWDDVDRLFDPGRDLFIARSRREMTEHLEALLAEPARARALSDHGRATVEARHTCAHRAAELIEIVRGLSALEAA